MVNEKGCACTIPAENTRLTINILNMITVRGTGAKNNEILVKERVPF